MTRTTITMRRTRRRPLIHIGLAGLLLLLGLYTISKRSTPRHDHFDEDDEESHHDAHVAEQRQLFQQRLQTFELPQWHDHSASSTTSHDNNTLGVERIYYLNLAQRVDRRDEMAMLAATSNLQMERINAVDPLTLSSMTTAPLKTSTWTTEDASVHLSPGEVACWRTHADVWRTMVEQNIASAIVLEDDVDWHGEIRAQLNLMKGPLHDVMAKVDRLTWDTHDDGEVDEEDDVDHVSDHRPAYHGRPGWDVVHIGACTEASWLSRERLGGWETSETPFHAARELMESKPPFVAYADRTMASFDEIDPIDRQVLDSYAIPMPYDPRPFGQEGKGNRPHPNPLLPRRHDHIRIVQRSRWPLCTGAYMVSQQGARKLLYSTTRGIDKAVDQIMARMAYEGTLRSYSVVPPLVSQWKTGHAGADSDIHHTVPPVRVTRGCFTKALARGRVFSAIGCLLSSSATLPTTALDPVEAFMLRMAQRGNPSRGYSYGIGAGSVRGALGLRIMRPQE